ncbi:hypothetical protein FDECE_14417 [Fusarium decemcellulare]|nr:hypothetical protein FDECE_14417 [Fusarium decemcellulare]
MGRHDKDWHPARYEERRERQRRRAVAPIPTQSAAPEDVLDALDAMEPAGMSPSTQGLAAPTTLTTARPRHVTTTSSKVHKPRNAKPAFTHVQRRDGLWVRARCIVIPKIKSMGIIDGFASSLDLFLIKHPASKQKSTTIDASSSVKLVSTHSTKVKIRQPTNPHRKHEETTPVWIPHTSGPLSYDIILPTRLRWCIAVEDSEGKLSLAKVT